ncbi:proteasome regulatory particle subunit [Coprinopsis marcescibilis]|uniref:Proteasome regulatory particle subunit n=1 Tax=Coprinopsis marcescibilis TaxID=230819 RepID=A0A5C3KB97_COPMA|nr:proteasome regulatory particle subunit [Coprinopsis marcescibilis]
MMASRRLRLQSSSAAWASNTDSSVICQLLRDQETALLKLGEIYHDQQSTFMSQTTAKAKTTKLIRTLLSFFAHIPESLPVQKQTLLANIEWAQSHKRVFLKRSLETRLVGLYLDGQEYRKALGLADGLLAELKRLDDEMILTEVHLLESKIYRGIGNMAKAKLKMRPIGSFDVCTNSSKFDLLPAQPASGILHAEDTDYTTAYSYFYEAFEGMSAHGESGALGALKYMLLCKIMLNLPEDVTSLLTIKLAAKYAQLRDVESMRAVARAHQDRNLADFEKALREYWNELSSDPTIRSHLAALYDTLLQQNLLRIIEPYEVVEIAHVAEVVGQDLQAVEVKLSQMILDKVFSGVLDQGRGCLLVFDRQEEDEIYTSGIETLEEVGKVVQSLYAKTVKIA